MVYVCADDYGLCSIASERIRECVNSGSLNKVSVFPNFEDFNPSRLDFKAELSLHLNLVEGKALAKNGEINLLTDENGRFRCAFLKLLLLSVFRKKEFEKQVYSELKAQIKFWESKVSGGAPMLIDSHQHTHMIPSVFKMLMRVISDEKLEVKYLRIPAEPIMPYIKTPSLYFTYNFVNLIKQWLLKFLWQINKSEYRKNPVPTAYFFGILFSGFMDEKRVKKVLPHYRKKAQKHKKDIEILFHPGYMSAKDVGTDVCNRYFEKFYFSDGRRIEFDSVMNLNIKNHMKEVFDNGLY